MITDVQHFNTRKGIYTYCTLTGKDIEIAYSYGAQLLPAKNQDDLDNRFMFTDFKRYEEFVKATGR